jgi:hypothetical protein
MSKSGRSFAISLLARAGAATNLDGVADPDLMTKIV